MISPNIVFDSPLFSCFFAAPSLLTHIGRRSGIIYNSTGTLPLTQRIRFKNQQCSNTIGYFNKGRDRIASSKIKCLSNSLPLQASLGVDCIYAVFIDYKGSRCNQSTFLNSIEYCDKRKRGEKHPLQNPFSKR